MIFADGTFIDGSTSELSCDGPLREPFAVFCQVCASLYILILLQWVIIVGRGVPFVLSTYGRLDAAIETTLSLIKTNAKELNATCLFIFDVPISKCRVAATGLNGD